MGREEFGPRPGEDHVAFHARLLAKAEGVLGRRPERPARDRINAMAFATTDFGTVPGGAEAAARTTGWVEQTKTEYGRVEAEVGALEVAARTAKELSTQAEAGTAAAALRGRPDD